MSSEILLITSWQPAETRAQCRLGRELEARGHVVHVFAPTDRHLQFADGLSGEVYCSIQHRDTVLPSPGEIEQRYDVPSIPHLYFTELQYFSLSRSEALRRTRSSAAVLERLFEEQDIDYAIQGRGGEVHRLLAHYLVDHFGGTSVWGEFSPFEDRVAYSTRLDGTWNTYETVEDGEIPTEGREWTDDYVDAFLDRKRVYTYGGGSDAGSLVRKAIDRIHGVAGGSTSTDVYRSAYRELGKKLAATANHRFLPSIEESRRKCLEERFVFFPLQFPIESRLTVFSPEYFDQSFLVEYLSRVVPAGVRLFVKQHPNHPGQQSPAWIRRLSRRHNVEFLHPSFNAHEAIEQAAAVVVTNNTVGFETLLHRTPLVVLGRAFYQDVPAATQVNDLSSLPAVLSNVIGTAPSDEAVRSSVYSLHEATYPGGQLHEIVREDDEGRLSVTADSLLQFVEQYA